MGAKQVMAGRKLRAVTAAAACPVAGSQRDSSQTCVSYQRGRWAGRGQKESRRTVPLCWIAKNMRISSRALGEPKVTAGIGVFPSGLSFY